MEDYSNVLSLENDTPQLTLYEKTESVFIENNSVEYTVEKVGVETSDDTYSKVNNVKATSPANFSEEGSRFDRLVYKRTSNFNDI